MLKASAAVAIGPPTVTVPAMSVSVWAAAGTAAADTVHVTVSVVAEVAFVNMHVQVALAGVMLPTFVLSTAVK